jgi:hypothetical protein
MNSNTSFEETFLDICKVTFNDCINEQFDKFKSMPIVKISPSPSLFNGIKLIFRKCLDLLCENIQSSIDKKTKIINDISKIDYSIPNKLDGHNIEQLLYKLSNFINENILTPLFEPNNNKIQNNDKILQILKSKICEKIQAISPLIQGQINKLIEDNNKLDIEFKNFKAKYLKEMEQKNDEISNLKSEKIKNSKDIIDLIQKNDLLQKENNELKANILTIQKKFEQKSKELEELNSVTKKLIQNKENTIIQYENELEMKNKEKNLLISQNEELLNKLNNGNNDKEEHKGNENYLLNEEIKSLKEQLEKQAHDLLSLDAMEKQISALQLENENLKKKEQGKTSDDSNNDLLTNSVKLKQNLSSNIDNSPIKKVKKRLSITILKDKNNNINDKTNNDTIILEKKAMTIAPKENDKINENEDIIKKENEQLKDEITKLKVKYFNSEFEKDTKITKFKNILKNIEQQCQKLGVTINLNFDKI